MSDTMHHPTKHHPHHHAPHLKQLFQPPIFRTAVVVPALQKIGLYSLDAEKLLMGTAARESEFTYLLQQNGGPARGLFQMEIATYNWLMDKVLAAKSHSDLRGLVLACATVPSPDASHMLVNHVFAAAMARIRYFVVSKAIPTSIRSQADFWRTYYNGISPHGRTANDYIATWNQYCAPLYGKV